MTTSKKWDYIPAVYMNGYTYTVLNVLVVTTSNGNKLTSEVLPGASILQTFEGRPLGSNTNWKQEQNLSTVHFDMVYVFTFLFHLSLSSSTPLAKSYSHPPTHFPFLLLTHSPVSHSPFTWTFGIHAVTKLSHTYLSFSSLKIAPLAGGNLFLSPPWLSLGSLLVCM